ncbi:MAG: acetoacetate decarboxylase family protein [Candidatus Heimdallarchaeota archaeon]|nr:acetoacetate decarboxylase family protein [Candidatus Heimdallarchaeota archaeon]
MQADPFFDVEQETVDTSQGMVDLPILYYEVENVIAFFLCDRKRVEAFLENTAYTLGLSLFGKAIIGLSFYKYKNTSIGSYNEVGIAIPVLKKVEKEPVSRYLNLYSKMEKRKIGFIILDLPVSTEIANAAGRELWGYPKFVTELPFELNGRVFYGAVMDPEKGEICTLQGKMGRGFKIPPLSLLLYSTVNEKDIKTDVNVRGKVNFGSGRKMRFSVGDSKHQMAQHLRDLGLDGKRPIMLFRTTAFQSRLNKGR